MIFWLTDRAGISEHELVFDLILRRRWWWIGFRHVRTPWIHADKVLKKTRLDLRKRFPIFHVCPKCLVALRSTWNWKDTGWLATRDCPLRTDFSILKISQIIHTIDFILQFLYLASEFKASILVFDQSSSCYCVGCRTLKSLQFFHFIEVFLMSFTKIPVLLQHLCMKKLMILSTSFFCLSTMKFFLLRLDRLTHCLKTLRSYSAWNSCCLISAWQSARICSPLSVQESPNLFAFRVCLWISYPCAWLASRQTTGFTVLSWLIDSDRHDDRPSPSERSARPSFLLKSVWPIVMSS